MAFSRTSYSKTIDTGPSTWTTTSGPGNSLYVGQTFTAKASFAESLTVHLGFRPVTMRLLVTEIEVINDRVFPGKIMFESVAFRTTDQPKAGTDPFDIALGGLHLEEGRQYAFVLDAWCQRENNEGIDNAKLGVTDYYSGNVYKGGKLIELRWFSGGSREEHFESGFKSAYSKDALFQMGFSDKAGTGFVGTSRSNEIYGGNTENIIHGGGGVDRIYAGGGADLVDGGNGGDTCYGQRGDDRL